jgi:ATP-dependent helicase HrpB
MGKLLLYAYPDRLAKRRSNSGGRYQLANGRGVFLFDDDPLFSSEWLIVADCDAQKKEGRIFSAVSIDYETLVDSLGDRLVVKDQFEFDSKNQKITGRRITEYGAITIKSTVLPEIPPEKFQECLLQVFQENGFTVLNWTARCEAWLARAQWLGEHLEAFPQLSKSALLESLDDWLLPYLSSVKSIADLKKVDVFELLLGTLSWGDQQLLNREAPTKYNTPSNKSVPIIYDSQQGPTVSVQLQEMFGELDSPKIAGGNIPLRFELLSPARRPIQTTSDLANFWKTSYFDVAKDMKGQYPKHRWPEQPLLEKPGRSIKRK